MKLTPWIPGDVKPVRVGAYQRRHPNWHGGFGYSHWNGVQWSVMQHTAENTTLRFARGESSMQNLPWKGIKK